MSAVSKWRFLHLAYFFSHLHISSFVCMFFFLVEMNVDRQNYCWVVTCHWMDSKLVDLVTLKITYPLHAVNRFVPHNSFIAIIINPSDGFPLMLVWLGIVALIRIIGYKVAQLYWCVFLVWSVISAKPAFNKEHKEPSHKELAQWVLHTFQYIQAALLLVRLR